MPTMPTAQKHLTYEQALPAPAVRRDTGGYRLARWMTIAALSCLVAVAGCSRGGRVAAANEPAPTGTALWLKDPCASDTTIDEFGWTKYELRDFTIRVPREYQRGTGSWGPDYLSLRRGSATLTLSLGKNSWYSLQSAMRAKPRLRSCNGEIGGYVASVVTYYDRGEYVYVVYWDHVFRVNGVSKWLIGTVRARMAEDANRLRQALLTVRLPEGTGWGQLGNCEWGIGRLGNGRFESEDWGVWSGEWSSNLRFQILNSQSYIIDYQIHHRQLSYCRFAPVSFVVRESNASRRIVVMA